MEYFLFLRKGIGKIELNECYVVILGFVFKLMTESGNELVNGILEAKVNSHTNKPTPQSSRYCLLF